MKQLFSIQSVSDIITNSSSEVFIMDFDKYEKTGHYRDWEKENIFTIEKIKDIKYPIEQCELEGICEIAGIKDPNDLEAVRGIEDLLWSDYDNGLLYWQNFVDEHIDNFNTIAGKILVNVSDDLGWEYVEKYIPELMKNGAKHYDGRNYSEMIKNL